MAAKTEAAKMVAGELYCAADPELAGKRKRARNLCERFSATPHARAADRLALLRDLLGGVGDRVEVEAPFTCDYGEYTVLADQVFINFGCVILDSAPVRVGARTMLGPAVHIYTATHNVEPEIRRAGLEFALPVTVGADVWIGGGAIIGPGVTIGDGATVGAGSVVIRDVPARAVVAGNPARLLRRLPPVEGPAGPA